MTRQELEMYLECTPKNQVFMAYQKFVFDVYRQRRHEIFLACIGSRPFDRDKWIGATNFKQGIGDIIREYYND